MESALAAFLVDSIWSLAVHAQAVYADSSIWDDRNSGSIAAWEDAGGCQQGVEGEIPGEHHCFS